MILAPPLEVINSVNVYVMSLFLSEDRVYLSFDSMQKVNEGIGVQADWLTTKFLNDIKCFGLHDH